MAEELQENFKRGLEGIIAGESKICKVNGAEGKLYYRGYRIEDLAKNCTFEEVTFLLLYSKLPTRKELTAFTKELARMGKLPPAIMKVLKDIAGKATPMDALRTAVSALAGADPDVKNARGDRNLAIGKSLIAKFPTIVTTYYRMSKGLPIVKPDPKLGYAANFLYTVKGKRPTAEEARAIDMDFVLHTEHSFNASTFAVRTTVSTLSDMYSALTTGIGVLKGPLHGGAAQAITEQFEQIGTVENTEPFVMKALANHQKLMGIGHRVYKVYDPRARIMKPEARSFSKRTGDMKWFEMAEIIERVMAREKKLYPNVDFFSAIIYHTMGLDIELTSPVFAIARSSGWVAHALEQYSDNRLIRPLDLYTGPLDLKFIPIDKRK
jgi:citrate synthase